MGVSDGCCVAFRARMWASKLSSYLMDRAVGSPITPSSHFGIDAMFILMLCFVSCVVCVFEIGVLACVVRFDCMNERVDF